MRLSLSDLSLTYLPLDLLDPACPRAMLLQADPRYRKWLMSLLPEPKRLNVTTSCIMITQS